MGSHSFIVVCLICLVITFLERIKMAFEIPVLGQIATDFAKQFAKQKDDIVLSAIKDFLQIDIINIRDLAGRCSVLSERHLKKETYLIDDKPFMELLDPVFENVKDEHNQFIYRQTQNYRRLF